MPNVLWSTREASTINLVVADLLCIRALHSRQFSWSFRFLTTQVKNIVWLMMSLASSIYLIPTLLPTCMLRTHSQSICGRYLSVSSLCCTEICVSGHYSGCATAESVPEVDWLLFHHVGRSWSPRSLPSLRQSPPSLWAPVPIHLVFQSPSGPTWEIVRISVMGSDCSNPPFGWPPRSQKYL